MSAEHLLPLFPAQQLVMRELIAKVSDNKPSILWAGVQAGKTTICRKISNTLAISQIAIGYYDEQFIGFSANSAFGHPFEFPLGKGSEAEHMWPYITDNTLVFIDGLFEIPDAELLYNRICALTPYVIAMGQMGNVPWSLSKYVDHFVGPYSTWELNPLMERDSLREQRPSNLTARRLFNRDTAACVEPLSVYALESR